MKNNRGARRSYRHMNNTTVREIFVIREVILHTVFSALRVIQTVQIREEYDRRTLLLTIFIATWKRCVFQRFALAERQYSPRRNKTAFHISIDYRVEQRCKDDLPKHSSRCCTSRFIPRRFASCRRSFFIGAFLLPVRDTTRRKTKSSKENMFRSRRPIRLNLQIYGVLRDDATE